MHLGSVLLIVWLVVGGFAAGQRGDYHAAGNCSKASTAAVTILAGPLNYLGVNPRIHCTTPQPSRYWSTTWRATACRRHGAQCWRYDPRSHESEVLSLRCGSWRNVRPWWGE